MSIESVISPTLNELSFLRGIIYYYFLRKKIYYGEVDTIIFANKHVINLLLSRAKLKNLFIKIHPPSTSKRHFIIPPMVQISLETERIIGDKITALENYYAFFLEKIPRDYRLYFKKEYLNYCKRKTSLLLEIKYHLDSTGSWSNSKIYLSSFELYLISTLGFNLPLQTLTRERKKISIFFNYINLLTIVCFGCLRVLIQSRPFSHRKEYKFGYEMIQNDPLTTPSQQLDREIVPSFVRQAEDLIFLINHKYIRKNKQKLSHFFSPYYYGPKDTGVIPVKKFFFYIRFILSRGKALCVCISSIDCFLFSKLCIGIVYETSFMSLLEKYLIRNYFSTDEYDAKHILRTGILRKNGLRSIGRIHGLPIAGSAIVWRYLDFDYIGVTGPHISNVLKKYWTGRTHPFVMGSWYGSFFSKKAPSTRSRDIVYFQSPMNSKGLEILEEIKKLAKHFPDRLVYIAAKKGSEKQQYFQRDYEKASPFPSNVVVYTGSSYDLIFKASYAITGGSTITAEAIQFGMITSVLDIDDNLTNFYYRQFPALCLDSIEKFIEKIESHEHCEVPHSNNSIDQLCPLDSNFSLSETFKKIIYGKE